MDSKTLGSTFPNPGILVNPDLGKLVALGVLDCVLGVVLLPLLRGGSEVEGSPAAAVVAVAEEDGVGVVAALFCLDLTKWSVNPSLMP